jgi:hypothetical protein
VADELENRGVISRGQFDEKVFAAQKIQSTQKKV